ncbi:MAG TPA: Zn-ribbon domain-containing OB-fold protein [Tepidiformaceae bacterium]|jgi:hypothetical protein
MTSEPAVSKPIPEPDEASGPFFEGGQRGVFMLMRCSACGTFRLPSRRHCDRCLSDQYTWEETSGRGVVRTFAIMHQRYHPGFADELPYNIALVQLDEGPRLPTNIVGIDNSEMRVGMPVVADWEQHSDVAIPKFRPA